MLPSSQKDITLHHNHNHKNISLYKSSNDNVNTFAHFFAHIKKDKDAKKLTILLVINLTVTFLELVYGFLSNSIGLISDAAHMLFDSTALAVGIYASYKAKLPPNLKFSYGYERFQTLAGFVNGIFLIFIAFYILIESLERIYDPPVIHSEKIIVVAIIGLIVNVIGVTFFHEHAHFHGGDEEHSCSHHNHNHQSHGHNHHSHKHSHELKEHSHSHSHSESRKTSLLDSHSHSHLDSETSTLNTIKEHEVHSIEDTERKHSHDHHHHDHKCNHNHEHHHHHHHANQHQETHHHHEEKTHSHSHEDHHHHDHEHHHDHSPNENLYGVFLHILADLLGSVGVIASSILIMMFGWYMADAICSAITSLLILVSVIPLLKSSIMVFMQTYPAKHEKEFHQILSEISHHPSVVECKEPHLWAFTHDKLVCSMVLMFKHNISDVNKVVRFAKDKLQKIKKIKYVTIDYQIEQNC